MAPDPASLAALKIERPAESPRGSRAPWWVLAVLLLLGGAAGIAWWRFPHATEVEIGRARAVSEADGRTLLNASGYVTARRAATVSSKVTGRVVEVLIEEGMVVQEGDLLARLDPTNVEINRRLAEAQLESVRRAVGETEALLVQADRMLERKRSLAAAKMIPVAELDQAVAEADMLRARIERQRAEIAVAQRQVERWDQEFEDTLIRAPFAGVVTSKDAQPGEMISPVSAGGGFTRTGICTIVDMSSLEVEVDVNESYIKRVQPGLPAKVSLDAYPDWEIASRVIAIIPTADRQKATVRVRIAFDQLDSRILPDMGLKVAFQSDDAAPAAATAAPRVVAPRRALQREGDRAVVWIVREGLVERRAVTAGEAQDDEVTILGGLSGGEALVLNPPPDLADGATVRVRAR